MKSLKVILFSLFVILSTISVVAQDTFQVGVDYGRLSFKPNFENPLEDVNAFEVSGLARVAGSTKGENGFKLRAGFGLRRTFDKEIFSNYLGTGVNIYRDVNTYYGIGELAYRYSFVEVAGRAKLGAEKPHEDMSYGFNRAYEFRGTIVSGNFGFTPVILGFKREPQGFTNYFGAGASFRF